MGVFFLGGGGFVCVCGWVVGYIYDIKGALFQEI